MQGIATETVGEHFQQDLLQRARDKTLELILEAAKNIRAGTSEAEAKKLIQEIQARLGSAKSWHPPQIRFGENSVLPFNGSDGVLGARFSHFSGGPEPGFPGFAGALRVVGPDWLPLWA